jgi:DNA repair exonuclease SbcCD ATPase subunit
MKVRAITLNNVRRFTDPVRISGISDGVNVLSAPNEFGKSTVFDALRAVFFVPHGSRGKEISQLRPHVGGAPEVGVEVETPDGTFVISKRWFNKPEARITRDNTLVAQADAAEAWIMHLLGDGDGGPAGLLWVRQGLVSLADGSNKEQQAALSARRDLLSSVTGEVEAMTGGRRMDAALARCREELAVYATSTGRPKAGGPWAVSMQEVEDLTVQRAALAERVATLQAALTERTSLRRELAEISAPDAVAEREARLEAAKAAHEAAQAYAEKANFALKALQIATISAERARHDLDALQVAKNDYALAVQNSEKAAAQLLETQHLLGSAEQALAAAVAEHDTAATAHQQAADLLQKVQMNAAALASKDRRAELLDRITQANAIRNLLEGASAAAIVGPEDHEVEQISKLAIAVTTARALRDSTATRVIMHYLPNQEGRLFHAEQPLAHDIALPIHDTTELQIDGVGTLTVLPRDGLDGEADVKGAEAKFTKALNDIGLASLGEAVDAHRKRKAAKEQVTLLQAELAVLAPKGIEDLQRQVAALPVLADEIEADLPSEEEALTSFQAAKSLATELASVRDAVRERRDDARTAGAEAIVRQEAAAERLQTAQTAIERLVKTDEAELTALVNQAESERMQAAAALQEIRAAAPDISATEATLKRVQSVNDAARHRIDELRPKIAGLNERITGNAGDAVEEQLQEIEEKLEIARSRHASVAREVKILQRLQTALEEARSEARDRYFEPIAGELRPLLQLLWPEAELNWADDTLLPQSLIRNGQEEQIDILSGGTQEQIAFLVRLAFARLLAKAGRHAPVILDDALVFTDDDRIERMFDALHRQAGDLQIIVLSCRQRAFRDLGGTSLRID